MAADTFSSLSAVAWDRYRILASEVVIGVPKILNKCILSILVYNLFLDRRRNILYTPQYFNTPVYWQSSNSIIF